MKKATILIALVLACAGASTAAAQDFSFRDHRIGDPLEKHKAKYTSTRKG